MEHKRSIEKRIGRKVEHYVKKAFKVLFLILFAVLLAFLVGYLVMRLWNWLMPELFGLSTIGYWQAVGMFILAKIFFGFGAGGPNKSKSKRGKKGGFGTSRICGPLKKDYETWKHYDQFWKEEGEIAYHNYLERIKEDKKVE